MSAAAATSLLAAARPWPSWADLCQSRLPGTRHARTPTVRFCPNPATLERRIGRQPPARRLQLKPIKPVGGATREVIDLPAIGPYPEIRPQGFPRFPCKGSDNLSCNRLSRLSLRVA